MPLTSTLSPHFAITYDASLRQLHGYWPGPVTDADLYAHYAELMAAAEAHENCRFWLLDMRQRNWHTPGFGRWFGHEFGAIAHAALGQPLFMAYVLSAAAHHAAATSAGVQATQCNSAAHGMYPFFFNHEAAALEWLAHQQALDPQALAVPQVGGRR